ncbi:protein kinase, partial [Candidatus Zixiibacteriota bacterium]
MEGSKVGHYTILAKLGAGGMGEVWLAEDIRLERKVALKFLHPGMDVDQESISRFRQEAIAASTIDHPNICTIHEISETEDGRTFICMAYYEGVSLRDRIGSSPLDEGEALDITQQIARGLEKAHQAGIIHRDIKPENIFLTDDGIVKILDFGLAKLSARTQLTVTGTTLGTASYLSPEQARGETVDRRTDLWSLGVVLFEMLTGNRPFHADDPQVVIYKILNEVPSYFDELGGTVSTEVVEIVEKALSKESETRYQTASEFSAEIAQLSEVQGQGIRHVSQRIRWVVPSLVAFIIILILIIIQPWQVSDTPRLSDIQILSGWEGLEDDPAWAPDGNTIAFTSRRNGNWDIWIHDLTSREFINLTEEHEGFDGRPVWSPDSDWIAYLSEQDGFGVYKISLRDLEVRKIAATDRFSTLRWLRGIPSLAWSPSGEWIAVASGQSIYRADPDGGTFEPIHKNLRQWSYSEVSWSPDSNWLAITELTGTAQTTSNIWIIRSDGTDLNPVTDGDSYDHNPVWDPDGSGMYFLSNRWGSKDLYWVGLDQQMLPQGTPRQITEGRGIGSFSSTPNCDRIVYCQSVDRANIWTLPYNEEQSISWGDAQSVTTDNQMIETISINSTRRQIAYDSDRLGNVEIFICDLDGSNEVQMTDHPAGDWAPTWSPEGDQLAFHSSRSGDRDIFTLSVTDRIVRPLVTNAQRDWFPVWSPKGDEIAYFSLRSGNWDGWVTRCDGSSEYQITTHQSADGAPFWTPDGEYLVFRSERTGRRELYRANRRTGQIDQLTNMQWRGIGGITWSPDGSEIILTAMGGPGNNGISLWAVSYPAGDARLLLDSKGSDKEIMWSVAQFEGQIYLPLSEPEGDL